MQKTIGPDLVNYSQFIVKQRHELAEWLGFETRNKYEILSPDGRQVGFAAEQGKGMLGLLLRQFLGHWRRFDLHFFTTDRVPFMTASHPFRWYFQELVVHDSDGRLLGRIQKRFSILSKRFTVYDALNHPLWEVSSPIWKIWTFPFTRNNQLIATVKKKWSGLITESMTDKDTFLIEVEDSKIPEASRRMLLAAALFIDLLYFEKKAD